MSNVVDGKRAHPAISGCLFEIDLILRRGDRLLGIECKRADAPRMTPSVRTALDELELERMAIVYPHDRRYPLADRVEVVPFCALAQPGGLFG